MAKNEPFYVVNAEKKIITVHKYIKPTEADTEIAICFAWHCFR